MIQLEINGARRSIDPGQTSELRRQIRDSIPPGHVCCVIRVNGIEIPEDRIDDFSIASIQRVEVRSGEPAELARQALDETGDWIERICGVLRSIADDYRLGRENEAASRLVNVVDALQVLVSLLYGIHASLDLDAGRRDLVDQSWLEAETELKGSVAALLQDLEGGDPVRLADQTAHVLPRSLDRFRDLLFEIRA